MVRDFNFVIFCMQRSIEALKLKNNVEKSTLNDIHMATIKVHIPGNFSAYKYTLGDPLSFIHMVTLYP